jgi:hypothetical protein
LGIAGVKEVIGDLWTYPADVRVITTNGTIKKNGECVMGRGCAAEAKSRSQTLPFLLGEKIKRVGNVPHILGSIVPTNDPDAIEPLLVSFPTKHNWYEKSDIKLIEVSAKILAGFADLYNWKVVVMPRPGCGNGWLQWENVRKVLEPILDDRFHVITKG